MLDVKYLRENIDQVSRRLSLRGEKVDLSRFLEIEEDRRSMLVKGESLKSERNRVNDEVARIKKEKGDASPLISRMKGVSDEIKQIDARISEISEELDRIVSVIPNIPHETVPVGTSDKDNAEVRKWGKPRTFDFTPVEHADLGERLGILDFARGAKLAGARFSLSIGAGARLERALISFMLDLHTTEHGYTEVLPPFMVNSKAMTGTGQLPKFAGDLFKVAETDYWLIPTAEVPVTNIYQDEIIEEEDLPIYRCAYTPCFRKEAGSYGKDTRGLIRQHQFNKVELVKFTRPEESYDELEKLTNNAEEVLRRLDLPYRVVSLCTGDLGFRLGKDLRYRGLAPRPERVPGDIVLQQLRGFSGPTGKHKIPGKGEEGDPPRAYAQRLRACRRQDGGGDTRELSAGRRIGRDTEGPRPVHGRENVDPLIERTVL